MPAASCYLPPSVGRHALGEESSKFAAEVAETLRGSLPGACAVVAEQLGNRYVVRPPKDSEVTLTVGGTSIGSLDVWFRCTVDTAGRYLAVDESQFSIRWGPVKEPLLRLHFVHSPGNRSRGPLACRQRACLPLSHPGARRQAQGAQSRRTAPSRGRGRMRPALEDLIEFLIKECGVDPAPGWEADLAVGRERWRRHQIGTLVRNAPEEAVRVLEENGYLVTLPPGGSR